MRLLGRPSLVVRPRRILPFCALLIVFCAGIVGLGTATPAAAQTTINQTSCIPDPV